MICSLQSMLLFGPPDARQQAIVMWRGPCLTLFHVESTSLNLAPTSNAVRVWMNCVLIGVLGLMFDAGEVHVHSTSGKNEELREIRFGHG
jgi:hypothetical protein